MKVPYISLVVVNYNGDKILRQCLVSLTRVSYTRDNYEIIVVDNNSNDRSISIIKSFKKVKLIRNSENKGYVGVNSCLEKVKGKYIFILNNDLEVDMNCIKELVKVAEKDEMIGTVVPKFINYFTRKIESSGTWVSRSFYTGHYSDAKEREKVKEVPYLGIEMIRTDLARKFGYIYDPDYFIYAEDLDLGLRSRLLGYKTVFVPTALVYHMHSATMNKISSNHRNAYLLERNILMTYFKVLSLKNLIILFPYVFIMRMFAVIKDVLTLNFRIAFSRIVAVVWIIVHFRLILEKRRKIQSMRIKKDNFLFEVFSEKYIFSRKKVAI